jgi:hypothetical protein
MDFYSKIRDVFNIYGEFGISSCVFLLRGRNMRASARAVPTVPRFGQAVADGGMS